MLQVQQLILGINTNNNMEWKQQLRDTSNDVQAL